MSTHTKDWQNANQRRRRACCCRVRTYSIVRQFGATENAEVKNAGASKMQGWKSREKRVWRAEIPFYALHTPVVPVAVRHVCELLYTPFNSLNLLQNSRQTNGRPDERTDRISFNAPSTAASFCVPSHTLGCKSDAAICPSVRLSDCRMPLVQQRSVTRIPIAVYLSLIHISEPTRPY